MIYRRYLLSHFVRAFGLALCVFCGLYFLGEFLDKIDNFLDKKAPVELYLRYCLNLLPVIIQTVLPLALLMGVFMCIGGLSRTNELTAMRAGGIGFWRIARPLLIFSAAAGLILFLAGEFSIPGNIRSVQQIVHELKGKQTGQKEKPVWLREQGRVASAAEYNPYDQILTGTTVFIFAADGKVFERRDAATATFDTDRNRWIAPRIEVRRFNATGDLVSLSTEQERDLGIDHTPRDLETLESQADQLRIGRLIEIIDLLRNEGLATRFHEVELHSRFASPFACLIMALLGLPFALQSGRRSTLGTGIGISAGIGISYQIVTSALVAFGGAGLISPLLAAWGGNIIFFSIALWLMLRVRQ